MRTYLAIAHKIKKIQILKINHSIHLPYLVRIASSDLLGQEEGHLALVEIDDGLEQIHNPQLSRMLVIHLIAIDFSGKLKTN